MSGINLNCLDYLYIMYIFICCIIVSYSTSTYGNPVVTSPAPSYSSQIKGTATSLPQQQTQQQPMQQPQQVQSQQPQSRPKTQRTRLPPPSKVYFCDTFFFFFFFFFFL
jgi:hypothetical protein